MAEGTVIAENTVGELMQDSVSRTLAIEMLDGVWKAGESLTLEALQSRFGISRTVAREVAKTLESMNAVLVKRRIGLVARPFGEWQALNHQVIEWRLHSTQRERQLSSLTELRLAVEPAAAASAARLAPIDVKAKFPVYAARMRQIAEAPCSTLSTKWHVPSISSDFRISIASFVDSEEDCNCDYYAVDSCHA